MGINVERTKRNDDHTVKYLAVVLDLDGTLLNSDKNVSERNVNAILNAYKTGMKVIFATARPPRAVNELLPQELISIASLILYNGALITCKTTGTEEHSPIDVELSNELIDSWTQWFPNIEMSFEVKDEWYSLTKIDYAMIQRRKGNPVIKSRDELKEIAPTKILMTSFGDAARILEKFSSRLNMVITDHGKLLQVMAKEVSATNDNEGVAQVLERILGLPQQTTS